METQRNIIERYIAASPDLQLVECYADNDKTGTNFNHPAFQQMMADIEAEKINCIIVKDLSRFGRNAIDAGYYLERYLPAKGVRFIAVNDSHDSLTSDGGIMLPIKNILAESYALDIGRKCKAVQHQKMLDGKFLGNYAPYGYLKSPSDSGKLVIDPETASIVQQIFAWGADGETYNEIARRLHEKQIPTPSYHKRSKGLIKSEAIVGNGHWTRRTLSDMLADPVYVGHMVQGKMSVVAGHSVQVPSDQWITVPNTHEGLVSQELFDRVGRQMKRLAQQFKGKAPPAIPYSENLFRGKIYCSHYGGLMHRKRQNKDGTYWFRCETQQKYGKQACEVVSIREQDILNVLMVMLHQQNKLMTGHYQSLLRQHDTISEDTALVAARTVQRIFQLAQQGESTKSIVQTLYREQRPIPAVCRGEKKSDDMSCIWTASVLSKILHDEQYLGTYIAGTTKVEGFGSKRRVPTPESEWIKIPDHHPAIISQTQFDMVQAIWKQSRKTRGTSAQSVTKPMSHLSGKVYCGHCGHKLRQNTSKTPCFDCKFTRPIPDSPCHKLKVTTADLEAQVFEELVHRVNTHLSTAEPVEVMQTPDKAQSLYEAFVAGKIDAHTYQSLKALTDKPQSKKKEHSSQGERYTLKEKSLTPELVEEWIEKVFYFPDGHIEVQWREPVTGKNPSK